METKITIQKLKLLLNKDYQKVSTNGGKNYYWTCSSLSRTGNCVDRIMLSNDGGEWEETIYVKDITHIIIWHKNKGDIKKEIMEVEHGNN